MTAATAASRTAGRPRDPGTGQAILAATLSLLAEDGYDRLTTDRIAERAGVGKAAIYRRWASKEEVVAAAALRLSEEVPAPDTGDLRGDLTAIVEALASVFAEDATVRLVSALVARIPHDPVLATNLRDGFLAARRRAARQALERAQERGELDGAVDLEFAVDLLAAPFYYRLLVTGAPVDNGFAHQVLDAALAAVATLR